MPSIEVPTDSPRHRKRSSPTSTLHSSNSNSALVYPVPDSVAWLEQLALSVNTSSAKLRDATFELHVDHARAKVAWVHARSFEDFRQFQHRLQKALRHGHFCHAECPWLYTFVRSYFPKSYVLGGLLAPGRVIQTRREALERFVRTLQTFLVNRSNHCCSVLTAAVADEVLTFINGDAGKVHQCRIAPKISSDCATLAATGLPAPPPTSLPRRSWDSIDTADSEKVAVEERAESEPPSSSTAVDEDDMCRICQSYLGDEANSPTSGSPTPPVSSSSTDSSAPGSSSQTQSPAHEQMSPVPAIALPPRAPPVAPRRVSSQRQQQHFYTTRLACGHRFHDECIVPKLNESMSCPVCGHAER